MTHCIFCRILAGIAPGSLFYRDDRVAAFMDHRPVNAGHVLVVPIRHAIGLGDLDPHDGERMFAVAQRVAAALRRAPARCEGVTIYLDDGAAAGQEVFHAHLHVIPRFAGDGFRLRHGPSTVAEPPRDRLDMMAAALRASM
jgi:diadenosine tetraphosphate (Ap4A) HIT family hydrolase